MSSLISSPGPGEAVNEEEAMRKRDEDQIQEECVSLRLLHRPPPRSWCHAMSPKPSLPEAPLQELGEHLCSGVPYSHQHPFNYTGAPTPSSFYSRSSIMFASQESGCRCSIVVGAGASESCLNAIPLLGN